MEKYKENNPEGSIGNIDNTGKSLLWTLLDYLFSLPYKALLSHKHNKTRIYKWKELRVILLGPI